MILQVQVEASLTRGPFVLGTSRGKGEKADISSNFLFFHFPSFKTDGAKQTKDLSDEMRRNRKIENDSKSLNWSTYPRLNTSRISPLRNQPGGSLMMKALNPEKTPMGETTPCTPKVASPEWLGC